MARPRPLISGQGTLRQGGSYYLEHQPVLLAEGLHFGEGRALQSFSLRVHICKEQHRACELRDPRTLSCPHSSVFGLTCLHYETNEKIQTLRALRGK